MASTIASALRGGFEALKNWYNSNVMDEDKDTTDELLFEAARSETNPLTPVYIRSFGRTGAGKSSFFNEILNGPVLNVNSMRAGTKDVHLIELPVAEGLPPIVLVDGPGFLESPGIEGNLLEVHVRAERHIHSKTGNGADIYLWMLDLGDKRFALTVRQVIWRLRKIEAASGVDIFDRLLIIGTNADAIYVGWPRTWLRKVEAIRDEIENAGGPRIDAERFIPVSNNPEPEAVRVQGWNTVKNQDGIEFPWAPYFFEYVLSDTTLLNHLKQLLLQKFLAMRFNSRELPLGVEGARMHYIETVIPVVSPANIDDHKVSPEDAANAEVLSEETVRFDSSPTDMQPDSQQLQLLSHIILTLKVKRDQAKAIVEGIHRKLRVFSVSMLFEMINSSRVQANEVDTNIRAIIADLELNQTYADVLLNNLRRTENETISKLGVGFDLTCGEERRPILWVTRDDRMEEPATYIESRVLTVADIREQNRRRGVGGDLRFRVGDVRIDNEFAFNRRMTETFRNVDAIMQYRIRRRTVSLAGLPSLKPEVYTGLLQALSASTAENIVPILRFIENFGTHFIEKYSEGGELSCNFTSTDDENVEIPTDLKGRVSMAFSFLSASASAELVNSEIRQANVRLTSMQARGGDPALVTRSNPLDSASFENERANIASNIERWAASVSQNKVLIYDGTFILRDISVLVAQLQFPGFETSDAVEREHIVSEKRRLVIMALNTYFQKAGVAQNASGTIAQPAPALTTTFNGAALANSRESRTLSKNEYMARLKKAKRVRWYDVFTLGISYAVRVRRTKALPHRQ